MSFNVAILGAGPPHSARLALHDGMRARATKRPMHLPISFNAAVHRVTDQLKTVFPKGPLQPAKESV